MDTSIKDLKSGKLKRAIKFIVVFSAGVITTIAATYAILEYNKKPEIYFAWFDIDENGKLYLTKSAIAIFNEETLKTNEISFPIRLSFRNEGSKTAKSVWIELSYPASLKVKSSVSRSIRMKSNLNSYRHNIGDLVPSRSFVPLKEYDTVFLKANLISDEIITLSKDGIPNYMIILVASLKLDKTERNIGISIYSDNYGPIDMTAVLHFPSIFTYINWPPQARVNRIELKDKYIEPVLSVLEKYQEIDSWNHKYDEEITIRYSKLQYEPKGIIQLVYVNSQLRRAILDLNNDEIIDYELWDIDKDGKFDEKVTFEPKIKMIDWKLYIE